MYKDTQTDALLTIAFTLKHFQQLFDALVTSLKSLLLRLYPSFQLLQGKGKESIRATLESSADAVKLCKLEKLVVRIPVRCTFSADTVSANIIFLLILRW